VSQWGMKKRIRGARRLISGLCTRVVELELAHDSSLVSKLESKSTPRGP
jgi:hypothetical protein